MGLTSCRRFGQHLSFQRSRQGHRTCSPGLAMTPSLERMRLARMVEWTLAGILTVVIIFAHVRVFQYAGPLWRDEISSLRLATMPTLSAFWSALIYDPFPA